MIIVLKQLDYLLTKLFTKGWSLPHPCLGATEPFGCSFYMLSWHSLVFNFKPVHPKQIPPGSTLTTSLNILLCAGCQKLSYASNKAEWELWSLFGLVVWLSLESGRSLPSWAANSWVKKFCAKSLLVIVGRSSSFILSSVHLTYIFVVVVFFFKLHIGSF